MVELLGPESIGSGVRLESLDHGPGAEGLAKNWKTITAFAIEPSTLFILFTLAVFDWLVPLWSGLFTLLFYFHIISESARGRDSIEFPEVDSLWDVFAADAKYFAAHFLMILAFLLSAFSNLNQGGAAIWDNPLTRWLFIAGALLAPLLTVTVVLSGSAQEAFHPVNILRKARELGSTLILATAV